MCRYERIAIEAWLRRHSTSPKTNAPLQSNVMLPNHSVRQLAEKHFQLSQACGELQAAKFATVKEALAVRGSLAQNDVTAICEKSAQVLDSLMSRIEVWSVEGAEDWSDFESDVAARIARGKETIKRLEASVADGLLKMERRGQQLAEIRQKLQQISVERQQREKKACLASMH